MSWIKAIGVTFSTYTAIPMPKFEWDEKAMRLAIGFLPLAGIAAGAALWLWTYVCALLNVGNILFAAVAASLPIFITGGIHLDGFSDTVDALSSRQPRERKLEILKDPHMGAFAVIWCIVYILLSFGAFTQRPDIWLISLGYVLSRALTALCAVTLPNARKSGMLVSFTENAGRRTALTLSMIFIAAAGSCMLLLSPKAGSISIAAAAAVTLQYRSMTLREFGGATGDTSGYLLQTSELFILLGAALGGQL